MIVLRMAGKILLLPVWLLLATAHLLVKIAVEIYCIGKGIINLTCLAPIGTIASGTDNGIWILFIFMQPTRGISIAPSVDRGLWLSKGSRTTQN